MARGSAWMKAKMAKLAKERREKFNPETTVRRPGHTIERSNHLTQELATLRASYGGVVTLCPPGREPVRQGKGKRQFDAPAKLDMLNGGWRKYETRERVRRDYWDLWGTSDRLIRNGVEVR